MRDKITFKLAVGYIPRTKQNIAEVAVLLNGHTMRTFSTMQEAEDYAKALREQYPNNTHKDT